MGALREADRRGLRVEGATMYSTLEPCSFHGRTPACSRVCVDRRIRRVVLGMRDPNPRVDGEGIRILREAGIEVVESVCEEQVRRQLGSWVLTFHPHEPVRRARAMAGKMTLHELTETMAALYAVDVARIEPLIRSALA
jgi:diaminohydroxyphosphoribosylaminopyrimidine deaminase/5-amino-6-(5-phosphoribosylamino)uracil reductase